MFDFPISYELIFQILQLCLSAIIIMIVGYSIVKLIMKILDKYGKKHEEAGLTALGIKNEEGSE